MNANESNVRRHNSSQGSKKRRLMSDERQHAVRACDSCRRLEEKYVGRVPCERCKRHNRACEFSDNPVKNITTSLRTVQGDAGNPENLRDLQQRAPYMGQIIQHYDPEIELGTDSLREKVKSLQAINTIAPEDEASSAGEDALVIEDEN